MKYKDSGVDIKEGDKFSDFLYRCSKETWKNKEGLREIICPYDDFGGVRYIDVSKLRRNSVMSMNFDGIGTKVGLAELTGTYRGLPYDLMAMVCDDAAAMGGEPMLVGSILDVDNIIKAKNSGVTTDIGYEYIEAAREANVSIINGEIAELGDRIKGNSTILNLNWGAGCVWFANKKNLIDRTKIQCGDFLVGMGELGFRSNGYSLIRQIVLENLDYFISDFYIQDNLMIPSSIYTRALVEMTGGYYGNPSTEIHGICHITGGGLYGKIKRMLKPCCLGAEIKNPFIPRPFMKKIQKLGMVSDKEAYRTWNMGQGMVIVTPDPETIISISKKHGHDAKIIGTIIKDNTIFIRNYGVFARTDFLEFRDV